MMDALKTRKVGLIGFGSMAKAMADGWLYTETLTGAQLGAYRRDQAQLGEDTQARAMRAFDSLEALVAWADVCVVCVKPWAVQKVLEPVKDALVGKVVLSVASGVSFEDYESFLAPGTEHWTLLPNTPVAVGKGVLVMEEKHNLTDEHATWANALCDALGLKVSSNAAEFKVAGLVAGCGPAYVAMMMEALADGAVKNGLPRAKAYPIISAMVEGTARLQLETKMHPGAMKDAVCSPGGSTIRGVDALETHGVRAGFIAAVDAIIKA